MYGALVAPQPDAGEGLIARLCRAVRMALETLGVGVPEGHRQEIEASRAAADEMEQRLSVLRRQVDLLKRSQK